MAVLGLTMPPRNLTFVASKSVSAIGNDQSAKHDAKTDLEWLQLMKNGPSALLEPILENSRQPAESITQLTNLLIPDVLRLDLTTVQCAHQMFCALMLGLLGKGTHSGSWRSRSVIKSIPGCTCANGKSASAWILSNTITWTPVRSFGFENGHSFCCHQQLREATLVEGIQSSFGHKPLKQKKTWSRIHMPCWGLSWRQGCDML